MMIFGFCMLFFHPRCPLCLLPPTMHTPEENKWELLMVGELYLIFFCHSPGHSQIMTMQLNRRVMGEKATVDTLCPGLLVPIIANSPMLAILAPFPSWAQSLASWLCPRGTEEPRDRGALACIPPGVLHWLPPWARREDSRVERPFGALPLGPGTASCVWDLASLKLPIRTCHARLDLFTTRFLPLREEAIGAFAIGGG